MEATCTASGLLRWPHFMGGRFFLVLLFIGCLAHSSAGAPASDQLIGRAAPGFTRTSLHGEAVSLSGYRGKVVLLNFWATWCGPCRAELPRFDLWQTKYKTRGLQVVAVAMDDEPVLVRSVAEKLRLRYPVVLGDAQLGNDYGGIFGLPVTYLIDRDGVVRKRIEGEANPTQLERELRAVLSESPQ